MKESPESERLKLSIEICCDEMGDAVMMNAYRQGIIQNGDGTLDIWWDDGDCTPLRYCPSCGKPIKVLDGGKSVYKAF